MDDIIKKFLEEVDDIEKSPLFMEDDDDEPTTEWVEEIDPRTNFPFYWNSATKESVWDKPESYDEYLIDYERYLKNVMDLQCIERAREQHEDNMKKLNDMRGLLCYSDSEDEGNNVEDVIEEEVNMVEETKVIEESEPEESIYSKKERWMSEQVTLAQQYLNNLVKGMSDTVLVKLPLLTKGSNNSDILLPIGERVQTRLEDWEGGHLTIQRTVDKLREALISISKFEGDLESVNWKLQWNNNTMKYYFVNTITGKKKLSFSNSKSIYEDGEIVDDDEDLTSDLHDYVISTLHRSLQEVDNNTGNIAKGDENNKTLPDDLHTSPKDDTSVPVKSNQVSSLIEDNGTGDDTLLTTTIDDTLIVENGTLVDNTTLEKTRNDRISSIEGMEENNIMAGEEVKQMEGNGADMMEGEEVDKTEVEEVHNTEDQEVDKTDVKEDCLMAVEETELKDVHVNDDIENLMIFNEEECIMQNNSVNMFAELEVDKIDGLKTVNNDSEIIDDRLCVSEDNNDAIIDGHIGTSGEECHVMEDIGDSNREAVSLPDSELSPTDQLTEDQHLDVQLDVDGTKGHCVADETVSVYKEHCEMDCDDSRQFKSLVAYLDEDDVTDEESG